jgi:hypothetical protein
MWALQLKPEPQGRSGTPAAEVTAALSAAAPGLVAWSAHSQRGLVLVGAADEAGGKHVSASSPAHEAARCRVAIGHARVRLQARVLATALAGAAFVPDPGARTAAARVSSAQQSRPAPARRLEAKPTHLTAPQVSREAAEALAAAGWGGRGGGAPAAAGEPLVAALQRCKGDARIRGPALRVCIGWREQKSRPVPLRMGRMLRWIQGLVVTATLPGTKHRHAGSAPCQRSSQSTTPSPSRACAPAPPEPRCCRPARCEPTSATPLGSQQPSPTLFCCGCSRPPWRRATWQLPPPGAGSLPPRRGLAAAGARSTRTALRPRC